MARVINPEIFREYDIRGVAEEELTEEVVLSLGRAVGTLLRDRGCRRLSLGRDCRLSSERLRDALCQGLVGTGLEVLDLGVCHTPLLYFSLHRLQVDGGVMITGSHNPAEYNGFKVAVGHLTIHGEEIQQVRRIAESARFASGRGGVEPVSLLGEYVDHLLTITPPLESPPSLVVDCGNGTAATVAPDLYRRLGCRVRELYCSMDGHFPNHHPDPTVVENLGDLIRTVRREGADLGLAFDGDGDRIGAVDDAGNIIWGDQLMILYSREILREHPGAAIIGEVKCSRNLYREIDKAGGRAIMWKAGHSLIKSKMKEEGAVLAGEMSGHMFFADRYFGYDDAVYAGIRLLEILSRAGSRMSVLLADVPKLYSTPELRMECPDRYKFEVVRRAQEYFGQRYRTVQVDGVRIEMEEGWGLVRASNTQPALVLRFEATSREKVEQMRALVEERLMEFMRESALELETQELPGS